MAAATLLQMSNWESTLAVGLPMVGLGSIALLPRDRERLIVLKSPSISFCTCSQKHTNLSSGLAKPPREMSVSGVPSIRSFFRFVVDTVLPGTPWLEQIENSYQSIIMCFPATNVVILMPEIRCQILEI